MTSSPDSKSFARVLERITGALPAVLLLLVFGGVAMAAGPVYWDYPEHVDFETLAGGGAALDEYGRLIPGLAVTQELSSASELFWSLAVDEDGVTYAGSGHEGRIWRIEDGEATVLCSVPEPEIFALLPTRECLWAAGGPDGLLYRIDKDGKVEVWADLSEGYIWCLAAGRRDEIYIAAGSPAALYVLRGRHEVERLAVLPAANALEVAALDDGTLLVATQGPGLIYRFDPEDTDSLHLLAEIEQDEIRNLVPGPDGLLYALAVDKEKEESASANGRHGNGNGSGKTNGATGQSAAGVSALYRIESDGLVTPVWSGGQELLSAVWCEESGWLAAAGPEKDEKKPRLLALGAPGEARTVATMAVGDVLGLARRADSNGGWTVLAAMAYPGGVLAFSNAPAEEATVVAEPIDAGRPIHWGRLYWQGLADGDSRIEWSVRSGPRAQPDETWTDWSGTWDEADHKLDLPPSRYLQWRVHFSGPRPGAFVEAITVSGRQANLPPAIRYFEVQTGSVFTEGGLHGHDNTVTESFSNGLRIEYDVASRRDRQAGMQRVDQVNSVRTLVWLVDDPNGDRMEFQIAYRRTGEESWYAIGETTPEMLGSWDTSEVPDGRYVLQLTASDRPSNPRGQSLQARRLSAPLTVDNTEPEIDDFKLNRTEAGFRVSFKGEDRTSQLAEAWMEMPDGTRERLDPVDLICDSRSETFDLAVPWPPADGDRRSLATPEPWRVKVILADRRGNLAFAEGEVR